MIDVTQSARDAAADYMLSRHGDEFLAEAIRNGKADSAMTVQLVAAAEQRGMIAARDAAVKVAEDAVRCWRNFAKMNLPSSPSPVINEDRAKICDNLAQSIATMPTK